MDKRKFKCYECNHVWEVEFGTHRPSDCPKCGSINIHREDNEGQRSHRWRGRGRNRHFGWKHHESQT